MRWAIGLLALPLVACGLTGTGLVAGRHASSAPRRSSSAAPAPSERPADISGMDAPRPRTLRADATRRTLQIGFVGASVTRGWYVSAAADAFPQRTSELLAQRGQDVRWTVVARPGATVDVADGWQPPRGENVVVVHIVSNDFLYGTPLAGYRAGYRALLAHVRRASPRARLVCLGDWGRVGAVDRAGIAASGYDRVVSAACARDGGTYVPLNQIYDVPGARGPAAGSSPFGVTDDFHPNDLGQLLIAEAVLQGLDGHPPHETMPTAPVQVHAPPARPRPTPGTSPDTRSGRVPGARSGGARRAGRVAPRSGSASPTPRRPT
jgi:lysophospholipase L1-like esterase